MYILNRHIFPALVFGYIGIALIFLLRNSVPPQVIAMISVFFSLSAGVLAGVGDLAFIKQNKRWFFENYSMFRFQSKPKLNIKLIVEIIIIHFVVFTIVDQKIAAALIGRPLSLNEIPFFMLNIVLVPLYAHVIIGAASVSRYLDSLPDGGCNVAENNTQSCYGDREIMRLHEYVKKGRRYSMLAALIPLNWGASLILAIGKGLSAPKLLFYVIIVVLSVFIGFFFHIIHNSNISNALIGLSINKFTNRENPGCDEIFRTCCSFARQNKYVMLVMGTVLFPAIWYIEYLVLMSAAH